MAAFSSSGFSSSAFSTSAFDFSVTAATTAEQIGAPFGHKKKRKKEPVWDTILEPREYPRREPPRPVPVSAPEPVTEPVMVSAAEIRALGTRILIGRETQARFDAMKLRLQQELDDEEALLLLGVFD